MRSTTIALLAALGATAPVYASDCEHTGELSGVVKTINLSETMQYGVTKLSITSEGKQVFSGRGVIIGQIVGKQDNGLPILDHTIFLGDGTRIETHGDRVEQMIPTGKLENGVPCEFNVVERITDMWASRRLRRLSNDEHNVEATGTISYCSDYNRNNLQLNGTVCFR